MFCTETCVAEATIPLLTNLCELGFREDCPSKLILIRCDIDLPTGNEAAIAAALDTLITNGTLGATGKLKNFVWGDPTVASLQLADCDPAQDITTGRELTFEDYNASDVDSTGTAFPYFDRYFWRTVKARQIYNYGWSTCSGKLYFALKPDGSTFLNGKLSAFQAEDRTQAGKCIEVKKGKVTFLGDPMDTLPVPYLDLAAASITTPSLAVLYK